MKKSKISNTPLTFDIREDLLKKVNSFKTKSRARSVSEVIRHALDTFSFTKFKPQVKNHKQISVRIPEDMRIALTKNAKVKNVSLGELLRAALEGLPATPKKSLAPAAKPAAKKKAPAKKKPVAKKKPASRASSRTTKRPASRAKKAPARSRSRR